MATVFNAKWVILKKRKFANVGYFEEKEICLNDCIQWQVGYFEEKEICLNDCIQWQVDYFEEKEIGKWVILKKRKLGYLPK